MKEVKRMNRIILLIIISLVPFSLSAQGEKKLVRQGNKQYEDKKYSEAEINYRKALETKANSTVATYNLGNSLYRQNKFQDATEQFNHAAEDNTDKLSKAKAYHNLGNSLLQAQKYPESVDAFKKALRNNPQDIETKYNLALAQQLSKNPPKQQNKQDNKDNKDKDKNKKNQDKKDDKKQDKDKNKQDQQDKNQQKQQQAGKISKEDAKRMLEAVQNDENNVQDKLKKEKAMAKKVKTDVDW
jgi:Ca-activated chloride channel homolog